MSIDAEIEDSLVGLMALNRNQIWRSPEVDCLIENQERYIELYRENGTIASLTHRIIMNREIAHSFCIILREMKELWTIEEVQLAFAEALQQGDSLLIDAISFLTQYRNIPCIQDAIAENIRTCHSILFQVHVASASLGLSGHPAIRQAIFDRREDIIASIRENWHHGVLVMWVPYLKGDDEVQQTIVDAKPKILEEIQCGAHLTDAAILIEQLDWMRKDPEIIEAIRKRILDQSREFESSLMTAVKETRLYEQYPQLVEAIDTCGEGIADWVFERW